MKTGIPKDAEQSYEYSKGHAAFLAGEPNDTNPYPKGNPRMGWYVGYYAARRERLYARLEAAEKPEQKGE